MSRSKRAIPLLQFKRFSIIVSRAVNRFGSFFRKWGVRWFCRQFRHSLIFPWMNGSFSLLNSALFASISMRIYLAPSEQSPIEGRRCLNVLWVWWLQIQFQCTYSNRHSFCVATPASVLLRISLTLWEKTSRFWIPDQQRNRAKILFFSLFDLNGNAFCWKYY